MHFTISEVVIPSMKIYAVYRLYCVDQTICFKVCNTVLLYAYTALYREMF